MTDVQSIKGVLFDVHDTLIIKDRRGPQQGVANSARALREAGYDVSEQRYEEAWRKAAQAARQDADELGEVTYDEWYGLIFDGLGLRDYGPDLIQKVDDAWNLPFASTTRALPQTKGVLRHLRPSYGLGIVSNSLAPNTLFDLRVAGILDFFDAIVISSDLGRRKPHPLIFLEALDRMDLEPGQAIFVGDNPYEDILGAKNVGMKTVLITHPLVEKARRQRGIALLAPKGDGAEPDACIRGMRELVPLLERWNRHSEGDHMGIEITLTGRVVTGQGQGAGFTQLPWAREQFLDKLGVDPYPGTFNLKIEDPGHLASLQTLWEQDGIPIPPPSTDFCAAKGFRVLVADLYPGAIVFPLVPGYPQDTIEIIAPLHLRSTLGADEGTVVTVKVTL